MGVLVAVGVTDVSDGLVEADGVGLASWLGDVEGCEEGIASLLRFVPSGVQVARNPINTQATAILLNTLLNAPDNFCKLSLLHSCGIFPGLRGFPLGFFWQIGGDFKTY